jgi:hypothetical protein
MFIEGLLLFCPPLKTARAPEHFEKFQALLYKLQHEPIALIALTCLELLFCQSIFALLFSAAEASCVLWP